MAKNSMEHPFGTTTQARHGRRCGFLAGSPAGSGRGDHRLPRAPTRGTPRCRRRSAPSMVNATRTGSPTAMAIAAEIGTLGWEPWSCASPRSGRGVTSLRPRRTETTPAQREGVAGSDPAGLRGRGIYEKSGRSGQVPGLRRDFEKSGVASASGGPGPGSGGVRLRRMGRPLDSGPYPYVWLDALTQKVREGGRIVNVSEDGAFWLASLRSLNARGLSGVELVISDAHQGLKDAIAMRLRRICGRRFVRLWRTAPTS